jgi:hypothetical protein
MQRQIITDKNPKGKRKILKLAGTIAREDITAIE